MPRTHTILIALLAGLALSLGAVGQDAPTTQPADAATDDAPAAEQPTAEDVLNELLRRRAENPMIEPTGDDTQTVNLAPQPTEATAQTGRVRLLREGQFLVNRRGRLVRTVNGASPWAFHFDADSSGLNDPPVFLMPCRLLEDAERIVERQGADTAFVLSGTAYAYHGANYILPTLIQQAPSRGNLQR